MRLLVEPVDVSPDGADIRLRTEGLANLVTGLHAVKPEFGLTLLAPDIVDPGWTAAGSHHDGVLMRGFRWVGVPKAMPSGWHKMPNSYILGT